VGDVARRNLWRRCTGPGRGSSLCHDQAAPSPARRGRPPKAAGVRPPTPATILDAAEDLFSKHGFYGVTIREVAREAGVDTALVHYYFGAKRGLFDAVFMSRAEVWNNDGSTPSTAMPETRARRRRWRGCWKPSCGRRSNGR
jgi:hypothetical protein